MNTHATSETLKGVLIKLLAIIGFLATIALIVWLAALGIRKAPGAFTSLASILESMQNRTPKELSVATEKSVVNSAESFQISWTDVKEEGEYHFTYSCTEGVVIEVRGADGSLLPIECTDTLTLPSNVHGLFLTVTSDESRFSDVPIKVSFTNPEKDVNLESETTVTVVNATIPAGGPVAITPESQTPAVPVSSANTGLYPEDVAPQAVPFADLAVLTLGSGVIENGSFRYSTVYDPDAHNAIRFDIKNIGTMTSGTWTFKTQLPGGEAYASEVQEALKPNEHVQFTLGFGMDSDEKIVKVTTTVHTTSDTNAANDSSVWHVAVQD